MTERQISHEDIDAVLTTGKLVQQYKDDVPIPSYLMLGWPGGKPLHVVAVDDEFTETTIVVTAYRTDPEFWEENFERRRE